ncbi:sensor histidine kinase [Paenibacillus castaneae]|nr:sensor histidine kinase [Paenibacillus castaneae]
MEKEDSYAAVQLLQNVNNMLSSYEMTADTAFSSSSFIQRLPVNNDSFFEAYDWYLDEFRPYIDWIVSARDISKITVYTSLSEYPFADIRPIDEAVKQEKWYKESVKGTNKLSKTWTVGESNLSHIRYFRLTYRFFERKTNAETIITFDLDERLLLNLISERDEGHRYIITLPNQDVLLDTFEPNRRGSSISSYGAEMKGMLKAVDAGSSPSSSIVGNNEHYLLTSASLTDRKSVSGLTLYSFSPLDELTRKLNKIRLQTIGLFFTVLLLSALVIYGFSSGITKRFYLLTKRMRSFDMNNLNQSVELKGNDELAQLGRVFNDMTARMKYLITEVIETKLASKELEIKAKESELYALQTQINPHYLFNTLNAICGNALENGDRETARIVQLLASSFRNVLQKGGNEISVRDELDIVRTYLDIQVFRFEDRLHYEIDVSERYQQCEVPRLSLQTLVENAIIHGVEKTDKRIRIYIWCEPIDDDRYALHVTNDGPGMTEERRAEVSAWLISETFLQKNSRIGLLNIHQRLRYMYGVDYGIRFSAATNTETTVSMILPYTSMRD